MTGEKKSDNTALRWDLLPCSSSAKSSSNPAHWLFAFSELPCGYSIKLVKRYSSGNYYLVDTFLAALRASASRTFFRRGTLSQNPCGTRKQGASIMAKGMWHLVGYPESMQPLENVLGVLRGSGATVAYILHDKDTYKEDVTRDGAKVHSAGDLKKAHYHFLCGWTKNFPDWDKLHDICDECKIPLGRYRDVKVMDEK